MTGVQTCALPICEDDFMQFHIARNLSEKPLTIYDYLGNSLGLEYYYRHPRSYARRGIFSIHEPSPTIRGVNRPMPKNYSLHSGDMVNSLDNIRSLTTIERSYIQTFPKEFKWEGSKTNLEQMIGNAVPVRLGQYIAQSISDYINSPSL